MKKVTDFAMVEYFVSNSTILPQEVSHYLKLYTPRYVRHPHTKQEGRLYIIPRHMMSEWLQKHIPNLEPSNLQPATGVDHAITN